MAGIIVLVVGGVAVSAGRMTLGQLLSFYVVAAVMRGYAATVSTSIPQIIAGQHSLVTLNEFLRLEAPPPYQGDMKVRFSGATTLEHVTFAYDQRTVLHDVSIEIRAGSIVALVGPNGSGKSTIINLILGLYRPQSGEIYADGYRLSDVDLACLRRQIGVVMQAPIIFPGTIYENIAYGTPAADYDAVRQAARLATAHEFIRRLPRGYDTLVGECGHLLSGGECQRIAIARALLRRPALLLLDEPTNHLDQDALDRILVHLTGFDYRPSILIISHQVEPIALAQRVYVLEEGTVVEVLDRKPWASLAFSQDAK